LNALRVIPAGILRDLVKSIAPVAAGTTDAAVEYHDGVPLLSSEQVHLSQWQVSACMSRLHELSARK
jgi:hypothetical protein